MLNKNLLAAAALAMSTQPFASPDLGYALPTCWSPSPSRGGKSRKKVVKARAK